MVDNHGPSAPVPDEVVERYDRHLLGDVPVVGGEGQRARRHRGYVERVAGQRHRHRLGGFHSQSHVIDRGFIVFVVGVWVVVVFFGDAQGHLAGQHVGSRHPAGHRVVVFVQEVPGILVPSPDVDVPFVVDQDVVRDPHQDVGGHPPYPGAGSRSHRGHHRPDHIRQRQIIVPVALLDGALVVAHQPAVGAARPELAGQRVAGLDHSLVLPHQAAGVPAGAGRQRGRRRVARPDVTELQVPGRQAAHHDRSGIAYIRDARQDVPVVVAHQPAPVVHVHVAHQERLRLDHVPIVLPHQRPGRLYSAATLDHGPVHRQVEHRAGPVQAAEQAQVIQVVPVDVHIVDPVPVAVEVPIEGRDRFPALALIPEGVLVVEVPVSVAVEVQVCDQLVARAALDGTAHAYVRVREGRGVVGGVGRRSCRVVIIVVCRAVAVQVPPHGVQLLQIPDLDQAVVIGVVIRKRAAIGIRKAAFAFGVVGIHPHAVAGARLQLGDSPGSGRAGVGMTDRDSRPALLVPHAVAVDGRLAGGVRRRPSHGQAGAGVRRHLQIGDRARRFGHVRHGQGHRRGVGELTVADRHVQGVGAIPLVVQ